MRILIVIEYLWTLYIILRESIFLLIELMEIIELWWETQTMTYYRLLQAVSPLIYYVSYIYYNIVYKIRYLDFHNNLFYRKNAFELNGTNVN